MPVTRAMIDVVGRSLNIEPAGIPVAILSHAGYAATAFEDPKLAVKAAAEMAPHLLITDVMMPGTNGVELAIHFQNFPEMQGALIFGTGRDCGLIDRRSIARLQIRPVR